MTVAVLAANDGREAQLRPHIPATLREGATGTETIAVLTHLTPYAGIPRTLNALYLAEELLSGDADAGTESAADRRSA